MGIKQKVKNKKRGLKNPDIRYLYDMKDVIYDKKWLRTAKNIPLYYMYRGVEKRGELRYDITQIPSKMLGKEFVKTKGNCNSKNYYELYIVLKGTALFLMEKKDPKNIDVVAIKARKGESVIVPAKYYVVTINPSPKELKIGNWVSEKNENTYKIMEQKMGACYYYTKQGWIKNKNYVNIPLLRHERPLKKIPKNLDFLYNSERVRRSIY